MKTFKTFRAIRVIVLFSAILFLVGCAEEGTVAQVAQMPTAVPAETLGVASNPGNNHSNAERIVATLKETPSYWNVPPADNIPVVFMTTDISSAALMEIFRALGVEPHGNVAINIHTGETPNNYHLRPDFIRELTHYVNGTFVETNVAYASRRASTLYHRMLAEEHGFTAVAPVDILDAYGYISIPVWEGSHLPYTLVGEHLVNYDFIINLSHFTGHGLSGFGAALKNMSLGLASREGKTLIHSAGRYREGFSPHTWNNDMFMESAIDTALAVSDFFGAENIVHINVLNNITLDCDCMVLQSQTGVHMHDIGILASLCPVALDQASVDLVRAAPDSETIVARINARNGELKFERAAYIEFGSRYYTLMSIDYLAESLP
ncbi:MAG: DUF362 domain-containing protein [Defluviitaleaceae bacterium]|nr:DUF362 domain-containing protein [Defluviitaleaceae bacterium]